MQTVTLYRRWRDGCFGAFTNYLNFVNETFVRHYMFEMIRQRKAAVIDEDWAISMPSSLNRYVCHWNVLSLNPKGRHTPTIKIHDKKDAPICFWLKTSSAVIISILFCYLSLTIKGLQHGYRWSNIAIQISKVVECRVSHIQKELSG